jgi:hypothetical protein
MFMTLTPHALKEAYFGMRHIRLPESSPLWTSTWASQQLAKTSDVYTRVTLEHTIFDLLNQTLIEAMLSLRQHYALPELSLNANLHESINELKRIGDTGNTRLMSFSAIYHYCGRAELELSLEKINHYLGVDGRVLRRHHEQTWRLLHIQFLKKESEVLRLQSRQ